MSSMANLIAETPVAVWRSWCVSALPRLVNPESRVLAVDMVDHRKPHCFGIEF